MPPVTGCIVGVFTSEYGVVLSGMAGLIVHNGLVCAFKKCGGVGGARGCCSVGMVLVVLLECALGVFECWSSGRVVNSVLVMCLVWY